MIREKNKAMFVISMFVVALSLLVHIMNRWFHLFESMGHSMHGDSSLEGLQNTIMLIPLIIEAVTFVFLRVSTHNSAIPLLNTLTLTFSSISIIAGTGGMVEFHFSIFMVLAIIVYYEQIALLLVSTALFAVQHVIGFFAFGQLIFGNSHYSISMILVHIVFVVLFNAGVIYQILIRRKVIAGLEREQHDRLQTAVGKIIHDTSTSSEGVMSNSRFLTQASADLNLLSTQILSIMNQLTDISKSQELGTQESAAAMEEVAAGISIIAGVSVQASEEVAESSQEVLKGERHIQAAIAGMNKVSEVMQSATQKFSSLEQHSNEIENVTSMNNFFSEQTKILALNASIEAARAGEYGRGFAVVAQEIRKLAEQSNQASTKIAELIAEIQQEIHTATLTLEMAVAEVGEGNQAVLLSGDAFHKISKSIQSVMDGMNTVSTTSQQISASTEEVSSTFGGVARTSRDLARDVNKVSTLSNEQLGLIQKCNELALKMEDLSQQLNEVINMTRQTFIA